MICIKDLLNGNTQNCYLEKNKSIGQNLTEYRIVKDVDNEGLKNVIDINRAGYLMLKKKGIKCIESTNARFLNYIPFAELNKGAIPLMEVFN